jgi:hypothetical protein
MRYCKNEDVHVYVSEGSYDKGLGELLQEVAYRIRKAEEENPEYLFEVHTKSSFSDGLGYQVDVYVHGGNIE